MRDGEGIEWDLGVGEGEVLVYCSVEEGGEGVCDWMAEKVGDAGKLGGIWELGARG